MLRQKGHQSILQWVFRLLIIAIRGVMRGVGEDVRHICGCNHCVNHGEDVPCQSDVGGKTRMKQEKKAKAKARAPGLA